MLPDIASTAGYNFADVHLEDDIRLFRANSLDQARDFLARKVSPHHLEVVEKRDQLDVHFRGILNDSISLMHIGYGSRVKAHPEEYRNLFFAQTMLKGNNKFTRGTDEVLLNPSQSIAIHDDFTRVAL